MILSLDTGYKPKRVLSHLPGQRCCSKPKLLLSAKSYDPKRKFVQCQRCMRVIMRRIK